MRPPGVSGDETPSMVVSPSTLRRRRPANPAGRARCKGERAVVCESIDALVDSVTAAARPGDHILCMSNGGFGGVHAKLLERLAARA